MRHVHLHKPQYKKNIVMKFVFCCLNILLGTETLTYSDILLYYVLKKRLLFFIFNKFYYIHE